MKRLAFLPLAVVAFLCGCSDRIIFPPEAPTPRDWIDQRSNTTVDLVEVQFLTRNIGWALGDFDTIVATTDGGATWTPYSYGRMSLNTFHFTDGENGWGGGRDGILMRTTDGGRSWKENVYDTTYRAGFIRDIFFIDPFVGWFVSDAGDIYLTIDRGVTWIRTNQGSAHPSDDLRCVRFLDPFNGCIVGSRQIGSDFQALVMRTNDGGLTWNEQVLPVPRAVTLSFTDYFNGWFGTLDGRIMRTTDGGVSWNEIGSRFDAGVREIQFTDPLRGWVVIDLPDIMIGGKEYDLLSGTTDGGAGWTSADRTMNLQKWVRLNSLHFFDAEYGWAVGDDGAIWHTTTSGRSPR